jgi:hypothetical protein
MVQIEPYGQRRAALRMRVVRKINPQGKNPQVQDVHIAYKNGLQG